MEFLHRNKYKLIISCVGFLLILVSVILIVISRNNLPFINDNPKSKVELNSVKSWIYAPKFSDNFDLQRIAESKYEVAVIRPDFKGRTIKKSEVNFLQSDNDKLILAQISLAQIDNERIYWKREWGDELPDWIKEENGYYYVEFWNKDWKQFIYGKAQSEIDIAIKAEFDGIYLDTSGFNKLDRAKQDEMVALVKSTSEYIRSKNSNLIIVASNIAEFDKDYYEDLNSKIDGISQEKLIYGNEKSGVLTSSNVKNKLKERLDKYKNANIPVFIIDYPFQCENSDDCYDTENVKRMRNSYQTIQSWGYIPYDLNMSKIGLVYSIPEVKSPAVETDIIPIFKWKHSSFNWNSKQAAYRVFVSSTKEKLENNNPDIYDSGKIWTDQNEHGFVPVKQIKEGNYFWKVVTYELHGENQLVGQWSSPQEFSYSVPENDNKPSNEVKQTAWIPDWAFEKGFDSFKNNYSAFESISPVWYDLNSDGSLKPLNSVNNEEFISFTKEKGVKLIPTIASFDPSEISGPLNEYRQKHIENILKVVEDGEYDGIDLDYEATYEKDKKEYEIFLKDLSQRMHDKNKILVVTVLSKWTGADVYTGLQETRVVQDWKMIGEYADEVRIMAYDWTYQSSYVAGPLSPYTWNESILQYAITMIPAEKIVLALPLYSYSFKVDDKSVISTDIFNGGETYGSDRRIYAYTYDEIVELGDLDEVEYDISYDNFAKEKIYKYFDGTNDRVMYFNDHESVIAKQNLAKEYGIKGIAYWRLGGDDARNY